MSDANTLFDGTTKQHRNTVCERDNVIKSAFINKDSVRCALEGGRFPLNTHPHTYKEKEQHLRSH